MYSPTAKRNAIQNQLSIGITHIIAMMDFMKHHSLFQKAARKCEGM